MPAYFFHVRGEHLDVPDLVGRQCDDLEAVRAEAELIAAELVENAQISGAPPPVGVIEVDDEAQRPVLAIPILARRA